MGRESVMRELDLLKNLYRPAVILLLLFLVLTGLKMFGVIDWNWLVILIPLFMGISWAACWFIMFYNALILVNDAAETANQITASAMKKKHWWE